MVAAVDVVMNDIADVSMAGQAGVSFVELVGLRRHDPDDASNGLILILAKLDPSAAVNIQAGEMEADITTRGGGRPLSTSGITLGGGDPTTETSVGRLLNSANLNEFNRAGNATSFPGTVGTLPSGLTLATMVNTALATAIRLTSGAATWEHWGGLFGQDFSDNFTMTVKWTPG